MKKQSYEGQNSLIQTASDAIEKNQLTAALSLLNEILVLNPDHAVALSKRGQVYGRLGDMPAALTDLRRSIKIDPINAESYFNYAIALALSGNEPEALIAIRRVNQLTPGDQEALAWRKQLAHKLGWEELDQAARALEYFVYSQCGPGENWRVDLREMHLFAAGAHNTYHAVVLDLQQSPQAMIQVTITPPGYGVKLIVERHLAKVPQTTLVEIISETVKAEPTALLAFLDKLLIDHILVKRDKRLVHESK